MYDGSYYYDIVRQNGNRTSPTADTPRALGGRVLAFFPKNVFCLLSLRLFTSPPSVYNPLETRPRPSETKKPNNRCVVVEKNSFLRLLEDNGQTYCRVFGRCLKKYVSHDNNNMVRLRTEIFTRAPCTCSAWTPQGRTIKHSSIIIFTPNRFNVHGVTRVRACISKRHSIQYRRHHTGLRTGCVEKFRRFYALESRHNDNEKKRD